MHDGPAGIMPIPPLFVNLVDDTSLLLPRASQPPMKSVLARYLASRGAPYGALSGQLVCPVSRLAELVSELVQLEPERPVEISLVVDTGLHAMKCTRQQVIDYGFTPTETERYIVWPGQACSYMVGQLRILELRENAQRQLDDKFSIKEFHNVVLRGGSMPLDVLAGEIDAWIAATKGK